MNLIGSKTIETKRLVLRSSKMEEQKRLYDVLMIPEVNKWYLTSGKKHANNKEHWTWDNQYRFYKSKIDTNNQIEKFVMPVYEKNCENYKKRLAELSKKTEFTPRDFIEIKSKSQVLIK